MTAPPRRRSLTPESWDALFAFLDPGRPGKHGQNRNAEAEDKFQEITRKLVWFFAGRGCGDAEDLAEETMLRVAGKCAELSIAAVADRVAYFYGVARNVHHERLREARRESTDRESAARDPTLFPVPDAQQRKNEDQEHRCLERCMASLSSGARRLILDYYRADEAKIAGHRKLAEQFGKSLNALRIDVHRIRNTLRRCVFECTHHQVARMVSS